MIQIFAVLLVIFLGINIVLLLSTKLSILECLILGYLLGYGFWAILLYFLGLNNIPIVFPYLNIILLFIDILLVICNSRKFYIFLKAINLKRPQLNISEFSNKNNLEKSLLVIITFICFSSFFYTITWPIREWDAIALYDLRAKIFFETGRLQDGLSDPYLVAHPPLTSLIHTWHYINGIENSGFWYSSVFTLFILYFYLQLKKYTHKTISAYLTLVLAAFPPLFSHSLLAYTNLPYMVYSFIGFLFLWQVFRKKENNNDIMFSALFIGFGTWIRSEDILWITAVIVGIGLGVYYKRYLKTLIFTSIVVLFYQLWTSNRYTYIESVSSGIIGNSPKLFSLLVTNLSFSRFIEVILMTWEHVITPNWFYIVVGLFQIILLMLFTKAKHWSIFFPIVVILSIILQIVALYIFSLITPKWISIGNSLERMSFFIPALILFGFGIFLQDLLNLLNPNNKKL